MRFDDKETLLRTTEEIQSGELQWPFWTKLVVVAIGKNHHQQKKYLGIKNCLRKETFRKKTSKKRPRIKNLLIKHSRNNLLRKNILEYKTSSEKTTLRKKNILPPQMIAMVINHDVSWQGSLEVLSSCTSNAKSTSNSAGSGKLTTELLLSR